MAIAARNVAVSLLKVEMKINEAHQAGDQAEY